MIRFNPDLEERSNSVDCAVTIGEKQIRMVAKVQEVFETEENLVAGACNHPNLLVLLFRLELIRVAA